MNAIKLASLFLTLPTRALTGQQVIASDGQGAGRYLRQLYYDSLIFTPEGLRHLIAEVGASQIVLGTDYPFPWVSASFSFCSLTT